MVILKATRVGLFALLSVLVLVGVASSQSETTGPLFSTPASRSTTGAPILNEPNQGGEGIIGSAGGGRSMQAQPEVGARSQISPKTGHVFGRWAVECAGVNSERICQIISRVNSSDQKQSVLVMSVARAKGGGGWRYQAAVPLGVAVQEKVEVEVADGYKVGLMVTRCTHQGCLLEGRLEEAFIDALKRSSEATFSIATPDGTRVPLVLSLDGFTQAITEIAL